MDADIKLNAKEAVDLMRGPVPKRGAVDAWPRAAAAALSSDERGRYEIRVNPVQIDADHDDFGSALIS